MGKMGDALMAGGKGMLDGMANMGGLPGNGLTPMSGMSMADGPMSGANLMEALFSQIFGKKDKQEDEGMNYAPSGIVGPR